MRENTATLLIKMNETYHCATKPCSVALLLKEKGVSCSYTLDENELDNKKNMDKSYLKHE